MRLINIDASPEMADWLRRGGHFGTKEWEEARHPRDAAGRFSEASEGSTPSQNPWNLTPSALTLVNVLAERAAESKERVSGDMQNVADQVGGTMVGLQHALKAPDRLHEKVSRVSVEDGITHDQAVANIGDALRYTMTFPTDRYTQGVTDAVRSLEEKNYIIDPDTTGPKWRETWDSPVYKGINSNWFAPDNNLRFELQFHTPESVGVKLDESPGSLHSLYAENQKESTTPERRADNERAMMKITGSIAIPPGVVALHNFPG